MRSRLESSCRSDAVRGFTVESMPFTYLSEGAGTTNQVETNGGCGSGGNESGENARPDGRGELSVDGLRIEGGGGGGIPRHRISYQLRHAAEQQRGCCELRALQHAEVHVHGCADVRRRHLCSRITRRRAR